MKEAVHNGCETCKHSDWYGYDNDVLVCWLRTTDDTPDGWYIVIADSVCDEYEPNEGLKYEAYIC